MSILDNIERTEPDVRKVVGSSCVLCPGVYRYSLIIVLSIGKHSSKCIEILFQKLEYLFYGYDYQLDVCNDRDYIRQLGNRYNFVSEPEWQLVIIQFNHRRSERRTIQMYIRLFMCIQAAYIDLEANDSYITDLVSLNTNGSHPELFVRDYSTKRYTLGIIWKYYIIKFGLGEFNHMDHIVNCMYSKLWPWSPPEREEDKKKRIEHILKYKI